MSNTRKSTTRASGLRLGLDALLWAMLVALMGYSITGGSWHEWLGIAFTVGALWHLWLNVAWLRTLTTGRYTALRWAKSLVNALMILALVVLIGSAIPISSEVFVWTGLISEGMLPAELHILASNWLFVLVAIHLGQQWQRVQMHLPESLVSARSARILLAHLGLYGLWAGYERGIVEKLAFYASFDPWRGDSDVVRFVLDYLGIFALVAQASFWGNRYIARLSRSPRA